MIVAGSMVYVQTGETNGGQFWQARSLVGILLLTLGSILELCGLKVLNPNEAYVFALFKNITERSRQLDFSG